MSFLAPWRDTNLFVSIPHDFVSRQQTARKNDIYNNSFDVSDKHIPNDFGVGNAIASNENHVGELVTTIHYSEYCYLLF